MVLSLYSNPIDFFARKPAQRARFKAIESLNNSSSRAVVVCTDVAARGLDIPSVSSVIHYDVARSVDTFVHRSGRTAVSPIFRLKLVLVTCFLGEDESIRLFGLESPTI